MKNLTTCLTCIVYSSCECTGNSTHCAKKKKKAMAKQAISYFRGDNVAYPTVLDTRPIGLHMLCATTGRQPRRRASAAVSRSDATLWLAATCNFMNKIVRTQYYANEVCNSCATSYSVCCKFYCSCNRGLILPHIRHVSKHIHQLCQAWRIINLCNVVHQVLK